MPISGPISGPDPGPAAGAADFLGSRPPFDEVGPEDLARVAAVTETEVSPRGKTIFSQGAGPVDYLWVVRAAEDTVCYGSQNTPGRDAYAEVSPVGGACFPAAETGTRRPVRSLNTQAV
jgi:hypothetical protein